MLKIIENNESLKRIILEVAEIADYLWQRGWAERNAGNISVNISELMNKEVLNYNSFPYFELSKSNPELASMYFLVTGTGKRMRDLARQPFKNALLIRIEEDGAGYRIISSMKDAVANFKPTSELPTHLSIHQMIKLRGSNEKVIIHTHANELVALTHNKNLKSEEKINRLLWGMHPETMVFVPKGVGFVPYVLPGTDEVAIPTVEVLKNHKIALWEKHGVFAIGEEVFDTFDSIDIIAKSAKIWFMCKQAGYEPEGLTQDQLDELKENYSS